MSAQHPIRQLLAAIAVGAISSFTFAISAAAAGADGIASTDGEQSGTRAVITELKRSNSTLTLKFTIYNESATPIDTGSRFNADGYRGSRTISGVTLVDSVGKKKYFAVKDSEGNCECSDGIDNIPPKSQIALWVKFPAPPDGVQKIVVQIPHFIPVDDVPIK